MAEIVTLAEAISATVHDGDTVAMEGFTHLIPHSAGHEVIRQGRRDLTLVRMTPDIIYDQLIGAGCARKLVFSWAGNPGVGSLHRFRDAVEHSWPQPLELEEHSHAGMANRFAAGAAGLPFAILRGYRGTSLADNTAGVKVLINYTYTIAASGQRLQYNNQLMGVTPTFQAQFYSTFQGQAVNLKLLACVSNKLAFATKLDDFVIPEFDFDILANAAGNVFDWDWAEVS